MIAWEDGLEDTPGGPARELVQRRTRGQYTVVGARLGASQEGERSTQGLFAVRRGGSWRGCRMIEAT